MKKLIAVILVFVIISVATGAFAINQDVPSNAAYSGAVSRVTSLGIMDTSASGTFNPNDVTTREQFSKSMVVIAGLSDQAGSMNGPTSFSDVPSDGSDNGYINEALNKGYITGKADGKFHPGDGITFAEVCTAMVKILGYTDQDIPGTWPQNYIGKAKALGLTAGVNLSSSAQVHRWEMAVMLDNLLDTDLKKANPTDPDKTLAQASSMTTDSMYTVYSKPEVAKNFIR